MQQMGVSPTSMSGLRNILRGTQQTGQQGMYGQSGQQGMYGQRGQPPMGPGGTRTPQIGQQAMYGQKAQPGMPPMRR